jgi:hypothetical protein
MGQAQKHPGCARGRGGTRREQNRDANGRCLGIPWNNQSETVKKMGRVKWKPALI